AVFQIEHPGAVAKHLEDHFATIGRDGGRANQPSLDRRAVHFRSAALEIEHRERVLVGVGDAAVVGKPRRAPRLTVAIVGQPRYPIRVERLQPEIPHFRIPGLTAHVRDAPAVGRPRRYGRVAGAAYALHAGPVPPRPADAP